MNKPKHFLAVLVAAFFIAFLNPMTIYAAELEIIFDDPVLQAQYEEQFQFQFMLQFQEQYMEQLTAAQEPEEEYYISEKDFNDLCYMAMDEAGNQGPDGIAYVVDCVLNRVDDPRFPNTIHDVLYQPNQFTTGHYHTPTEEVKTVVRQELISRKDSTIKWFARGIQPYGTFKFKFGAHYFNE